MDIQELERELRGLLRGEHSSLTLSFNDENGPNYMTVKDWVENGPSEPASDWVSEEERQKAIEANSMWTLHWYPDTPVGFCALSASSLEAVVKAALSD